MSTDIIMAFYFFFSLFVDMVKREKDQTSGKKSLIMLKLLLVKRCVDADVERKRKRSTIYSNLVRDYMTR